MIFWLLLFAKQRLKADPEKDKDKTSIISNPIYPWAQSKLQDKKVRKSMDVKGSQSGQSSSSNIFDMIFEKLLKPLWETLGDTAQNIWQDLKSIFKSGSTLTVADIFKNVGVDLLVGIIRAVRTSASFLFEVVLKIVSLFRSVFNTKLNIWVLTKLYKRVSGGDDLTFLDLACLVVLSQQRICSSCSLLERNLDLSPSLRNFSRSRDPHHLLLTPSPRANNFMRALRIWSLAIVRKILTANLVQHGVVNISLPQSTEALRTMLTFHASSEFAGWAW